MELSHCAARACVYYLRENTIENSSKHIGEQMYYDHNITKQTRTHYIQLSMMSGDLIHGAQLVANIQLIAAEIKPGQTIRRKCGLVMIILRANKNYTVENFLKEHMEFFNGLTQREKGN